MANGEIALAVGMTHGGVKDNSDNGEKPAINGQDELDAQDYIKKSQLAYGVNITSAPTQVGIKNASDADNTLSTRLLIRVSRHFNSENSKTKAIF